MLKFNLKNNVYKRILIIRTDRIGDVVLTTPSVKAVKDKFPNARVSLLVSASTVDLVKNSSFIDEILVDDKNGIHKGFLGFWGLIKTIKKRKFELVINFHTKKRTNLLCFLSGIPHRLGFKDKNFGFLLNYPVKDKRYKGEKHEVEYCFDVLRRLDIKFKTADLFVSVDKNAENWADHFFTSHHIESKDFLTAVHLGASDPSKMWPVEYFCTVIQDLINQKNAKIILIGDKKNWSLASQIISQCTGEIYHMVGETSLAQLISLLKRSKLLLSNDSGPVHIAAALHIPVVSIFTRNQSGINPERWKPLGPNSRYITIPLDNTTPFLKSGDASKEYLKQIEPSLIMSVIKDLFKN